MTFQSRRDTENEYYNLASYHGMNVEILNIKAQGVQVQKPKITGLSFNMKWCANLYFSHKRFCVHQSQDVENDLRFEICFYRELEVFGWK